MYFFLAFAACSANHAKSFFPPANQYRPTLRLGKAIQIFPSPVQRCWKSREGGKVHFCGLSRRYSGFVRERRGSAVTKLQFHKKEGGDMAFLL